jgi:transcriptional regulator with XRE-family HTH domain
MSNNKQIYEYIGKKIKELRETYGGKGLSQEQLAEKIETTPNTISRWETAVYKPKIDDLEKLAKFFSKTISSFLPDEYQTSNTPEMATLLRATADLPEEDLKILTEFAEYRKTRRVLDENKNGK